MAAILTNGVLVMSQHFQTVVELREASVAILLDDLSTGPSFIRSRECNS